MALVPVFDLANHEDGEFSTDFRTDAEAGGEGKGGLVCFAKRDFARGEQLRIFYGAASLPPVHIITILTGLSPLHARNLKQNFPHSDHPMHV